MYNEFASVYDKLIDIDYTKISQFYSSLFKKIGIKPHIVLDLGCGTGTLANEMSKLGFDVLGVDLSDEMLSLAKSKYPDILFIKQDMRELDLYGTCGAIYSSLDCINYILDESELAHVFSLCANFLDDGGAFVFDVSTPHKLANINGGNTFVIENENCFGVWENSFEGNILDMTLNFFVTDNGKTYTRFEENQTQRAWNRDEILRLSKDTGFRLYGIFDGFTFDRACERSERETYVLVKEMRR